MHRPSPKIVPPLAPGFRPAALAFRSFRAPAHDGGESLVLGFERADGDLARFETRVLPAGHPDAADNVEFVSLLVEVLLWQRGAFRVWVGGPAEIGSAVAGVFGAEGARAFDTGFHGETVSRRPFEVRCCEADEVPPEKRSERPLVGDLSGCRVGFDLGASDRKAAAVWDGRVVFSEAVPWDPASHSDAAWHLREILKSIRSAAAHLPRLDGIGGSIAGIHSGENILVSSLFRGVPEAEFGAIRNMPSIIIDQMWVPLVIENDGAVAALAGSLSLGVKGLLAVALGSSVAGGFLPPDGILGGRLDEMAFWPVDLGNDAPRDHWSARSGTAAELLSQRAVFRLAGDVGLDLDEDAPATERLAVVQAHLADGDERAVAIHRTIGRMLGYTIALAADLDPVEHVLLLGRVVSGEAGEILASEAKAVLAADFPDLAEQVSIHLPEEQARRVGQAVAAATLPPKTVLDGID